MRDIKFRAWHKKYSLFFRVSSIMFDGKMYITSAEDLGSLRDGRNSGEYHCLPEEVELMQFAGLQDKNGVEIYEGDIIQGGSRLADEVVFRDGLFQTAGGYRVIFTDEVIGNVYENPDLLK